MPWFPFLRRHRAALPLGVFLAGLCLAAASAWRLQHAVDSQARAEFERSVERVASDIVRRFRQPLYALDGAEGLYAASQQVDRSEFRAYVDTRGRHLAMPGVRGLGFVERVERSRLAAFVASARADGAPRFGIRELGPSRQDDLYVVKFIEPALGNAGALGLDLGSERARREAAERAVASGEATLTEALTLVQDDHRGPAFLMFQPVFGGATVPATPQQRRTALVGLLYVPIVVAELLGGVADAEAGLVEFDLFDTPAQPVFESVAHTGSAATVAPTPERVGRFSATRDVALPGRTLSLQVRATPRFEADASNSPAGLVFAGGALTSALLAALLAQQASGRRRAEALAEDMTADLARLALVARRTSNAVIITDRQLRITWVNDAFTRLYGHGREQALGRTPGELLGSGKSEPQALDTLRRSAQTGTGCRVELVNRAADGHDVWVDTEVQPVLDAAGQVTGFIEITSDTSASRQATRELAAQQRALANILEGTNVGTWEWNVATGETRFNERWAQILGHTVDELLPMSLETWSTLVHPDDAQRSAVQLERHFAGAAPRYECELRMRHKHGHWVWVLDRGQLFSRSADGRPQWMAGTHMDITERKQAEAALRASEDLLDRTGRIGGVGGWAYDLATRVIQWTDQTCRIHDREPGHQPGLEEAMAYYETDSREQLVAAVQHSIEHGDSYDLELRLVTATGRRIWVRGVGETEFADGRPVRMVGALQDITARRALESELRRNNALMHSVLESMPCGMSVFDAELNLVVANTEFRRLLALPERLFEARPTRFESIIRHNAERGDYGAESVETAVAERVALARAPSVPHQFERVLPDGTALEVRGSPMPGGGFVTTHTDITRRRAAEAQVRRSDQLLRGAIDAIDEAFVLFDPDDRLLFCNDKYRRLYATSSDLMVPGARFEDIVRQGALRGQYPAAAGRVDDWVAERMAAHRAGDSTLVQRLDDGRSLRIVERRMPDGHTVGFRIDITELLRATEAAQAASLAKGQFLANMSHEIRTPMNAILGMLTLLRKTGLTARQADYAAKTAGAANALLALLNDVLDYSKVEADKMVLDPQAFRVEQLLQDLSVILSASVGAKPVRVLFDIDPALPPELVGDAMRLQQVLVNLGGNAIKFTEQGEVVLSMMLVARDADSVTVEFAVRDTGIGIDPSHHERIFSGFTQAEASTTRRHGGSGLGLSISERLVGLMGGALRLDSALGLGSRFHFRISLPWVAQGGAVDVPTAATLRVLVLDTRATARALLQRMGGALGWQVDLADSGDSAAALLQDAAQRGVAYGALLVDAQVPQLHDWTQRQPRPGPGLAADAALVWMVGAMGRERLTPADQADTAHGGSFLVEPFTAAMLADAVAAARRLPVAPQAVGGGRLAGLRLLLVEDNLNNCQVAHELLEGEGASVHTVHDGQAAVDVVATAAPPFDAVLMDLHMPVMDGYTATGRIRKGLGLHALPIVAMTANALAADRDACLAAGMNDHIGKPFDLDRLVQVLRRLSDRPPHTPAPNAAPQRVGDAALDLAESHGVDLAGALRRLSDRPAVYRRLLQGFVVELAGLPEALRQCAAQDDPVLAVRHLHTLKGLSATLGATTLSAAAARAEEQWTASPPGAAVDAVARDLSQHIEAALPGLQALLQAMATPPDARPATPVDPVALTIALGALATLLQNSDMGATDAMASLMQDFGAALPGPLAALDAAVAGLEFERSARLCAELIEASRA